MPQGKFVVMLLAIMLSAVRLSAIALSVVASLKLLQGIPTKIYIKNSFKDCIIRG